MNPMKRVPTLLAAGTLALARVTPALTGSTGIQRSYGVTQPDPVTLAQLDQALDDTGQNETAPLQRQETDLLQQQQDALAADDAVRQETDLLQRQEATDELQGRQKALAAEMAAMRNPFLRLDYRR
jgi:hypothetical protein